MPLARAAGRASLTVRTRDDKHQQLDVDMSVSTYEKTKAAPPKKGEKP